MTARFQNLQLQQTDLMLSNWREARLPARPQNGWVRAVREALGMSATAAAKRVGMSLAGLRKLEKAEANNVITLASLQKLAESLDCELQYALVPRTSLAQTLKSRALQLAQERLAPVSHSMRLEDQSVEGALSKAQLELLAQELLGGSRRELWQE